MMMDEALESLIAHADPRLASAWGRFIEEQDARYDRLARESGQPYSRFTEHEVYEVARLAAALGVSPADDAALPAVARDGELVGAR